MLFPLHAVFRKVQGAELWTPQEIVTYRWYDYSDSSNIILDGNSKISEILDKKDPTKKAVQTTEASRPLLGNINGRQCMDSTTVDAAFMIDTFGETLSQQFYIFAVGLYTKPDAYLTDGLTTSNRAAIYLSNTNNFQRSFAGTQITSNLPVYLNEPLQVGARFNSTASNVEVDGGDAFVGNAGTNSIQGLTIGNRFVPTDLAKSDKIGEIIVLPYNPGTIDREFVQGYLAHRWGLADKLPALHPYKAFPPLKDYPLPLFSTTEGDPAFGLMYDISNIDTLYEDTAGTIPATLNGPVGKIMDLSLNGFDIVATSDTTRGTLRLDPSNNQYYIELAGANYQTTFTKAIVSAANQINVCMNKQMLASTSRAYLFELTVSGSLTSGVFRDGLFSMNYEGYTLKKDPSVPDGNFYPGYSIDPVRNPTLESYTYTLITKSISDPEMSTLSIDGVQQNLVSNSAGTENNDPYWLAHNDLKTLNIGTGGLSHGKLYNLYINNGDVAQLNKADQYFRYRLGTL